jgi:hypothetical protein
MRTGLRQRPQKQEIPKQKTRSLRDRNRKVDYYDPSSSPQPKSIPFKNELIQEIPLIENTEPPALERRLTRSFSSQQPLYTGFFYKRCFIDLEPEEKTPLVAITSHHTVFALDTNKVKGLSEFPISIINEAVIHAEKDEIIVPKFKKYQQRSKQSRQSSLEDTCDEAYFVRHRKKELAEKKSNNRDKEIYRYEMYLRNLEEQKRRHIEINMPNLLKKAQFHDSDSNLLVLENDWSAQISDEKPIRYGIFQGKELLKISDEAYQAIASKLGNSTLIEDQLPPLPILSNGKEEA